MKRLTSLLVFLMSGLVAYTDMSVANPPAAAGTTTNQTSSETFAYGPGPVMGGVGGVYFLASPGELTIEVQKQDLNRAKENTELRAILVGPDRQVIEDVSIPDDGQTSTKKSGPVQTIRLKTMVKRKGMYSLNITVSNDRYGDHITWGFKTNCPRYCIETARGHRDTPHAEPIVLRSPETAGNICFMPRPSELKIDVSGLRSAKQLEVFDVDGKTLATLPVDKRGKASHTFPPEVKRDGRPWRLHLPSQRATVNIDGITRWKWGDPEYDMAIWSNDIKTLFPLVPYRWLLSPYREKIYAKANAQGTYQFTVHNNSKQRATIDLALEFPGKKWTAELASKSIRLGKGEARQIELRYQAPPQSETRTVHLRATPQECPEVSTYSTLIVHTGMPSKESQEVKTPLQLQPYRWASEPFGNRPRYPVAHQPYFDLKNRPFVVNGHELTTLRNGTWEKTDLRKAVKSWTPSQSNWTYYTSTRAPAKVAFDRDNDVYLLTSVRRKAALLHSRDGGRTFSGYLLPGAIPRGTGYDFEQFSGHNTPDGPPPVARYVMKERHPDLVFRKVCRLELFVPEKDETGRISLGKPIVLSEKALATSHHSGIPSTIVSRGDKVHVVWGEATDPAKKGGPGAPMYVATYDKKTKKLSKPTLVSYGPPANDGHNTPSITIDSCGYLHVLGGTHNRPFPYTKSLVPNDSSQGWTEPVLITKNCGQTYIGLVCMPDDRLFTAFRRWGRHEEPFPESSIHAQLAYQSKPSDDDWVQPQILLKSTFSHYSIFFHRLTIDRRGRLFLSYCYWPTYFFYRNDRAFADRSLLMSEDGGKTWAFVKESDFSSK